MSIDIESETLIEFQHASGAFPGERRPAIATLHRWRQRGVRGVKLETVLIGGIRYTSREAIVRFIAAQNPNDVPATHVITATQRRKLAEAAHRALRKAGP